MALEYNPLSIKPVDVNTNFIFRKVDELTKYKEGNPGWLATAYAFLSKELSHANKTKRGDLINKVEAKMAELLGNATDEDVENWGRANYRGMSNRNLLWGPSEEDAIERAKAEKAKYSQR